MRGNHRSLGTLAAVAIAVLAASAGVTDAHPAATNPVFRAAELATHPIGAVAILPAVTVADDPAVERRVERSWAGVYRDAAEQWMTADEVRERLAAVPVEGERLAERADALVWRDGALDATTAANVARVLGVDAVLTLRIDRWEIVDGGRAIVAMTAVLTDESGRVLWSIRGNAGCGHGRTSGEGGFSWNLGTLRDPALEPRDEPHKLSLALYNLLARWAPELPTPIRQETVMPRLLAQLDDE